MTSSNDLSDEHYYERVRPGDECPQCGENDIDYLVWIDDERVRCDSCGPVYELGRRDGE